MNRFRLPTSDFRLGVLALALSSILATPALAQYSARLPSTGTGDFVRKNGGVLWDGTLRDPILQNADIAESGDEGIFLKTGLNGEIRHAVVGVDKDYMAIDAPPASGSVVIGNTTGAYFGFQGTDHYPDTGVAAGDVQRVINPLTKTDSSLLTDDTYAGDTITNLTNSGGATQWQLVYLNSSSQWVKADANGSGTYPARGIAVETKTTGLATVVLESGIFRDDGGTAWTPGGNLYLSTTPGILTQTAPATTGDKVQVVGYAITAHIVRVKIGTDYGTVP